MGAYRPMCANACNEHDNIAVKLSNSFLDTYEIVDADTAELRERSYRLRYQVYCVENAFEDPAENSGGVESDEYDDFSVHALVMHRPSGMAAGTVRLILPGAPLDPPLPFLASGDHAATDNNPSPFPIEQTAEISRFGISKKFRRAAGLSRAQTNLAVSGATTAPSYSGDADVVTVALIRAFIGLAARNEVQYFCAMMEKALLRRVARLGIYFDKVGDEVEFHGRRQPSAIRISVMLDRVLQEREDVWRIITDDGAYAPAFSKLLAAE